MSLNKSMQRARTYSMSPITKKSSTTHSKLVTVTVTVTVTVLLQNYLTFYYRPRHLSQIYLLKQLPATTESPSENDTCTNNGGTRVHRGPEMGHDWDSEFVILKVVLHAAIFFAASLTTPYKNCSMLHRLQRSNVLQ